VKYYAPAMWASALLIAACSPKVVETVTIRETQTVHDTITLRDSVRLVNDRVQVEVIRLPGERFYVKGTCKGDTVKLYTERTIKKVDRKADEKTEKAAMVIISILGLALLAVILKK
jgi:tetrahydrodipicolinate N-succinyltransferase